MASVDSFQPTRKPERTDPSIAIESLKRQANKAVKGSKVNLAIVLTAVGLAGAFAAYMLSETKAQAQTQVAPVQVQLNALDEKVNTHVGGSDKVHEEIKGQLKEQGSSLHTVELRQVRVELMLERVSERVGASVPPRVQVDGGN